MSPNQEPSERRSRAGWLAFGGAFVALLIWAGVRLLPLHPRQWAASHPAAVSAYSPDGRTLATGNQVVIRGHDSKNYWGYGSGEVQLRDARTGATRRVVPFLHPAVTQADDEANGGPVGDIRWSPDGRLLMASNLNAGDGDTIGVLDVATGRWLFARKGRWMPRRQVFRPVGFLPDSREAVYLEVDAPPPARQDMDETDWVAHSPRDSRLVICDADTGKTLRQYTSVIGVGEWPEQQALRPGGTEVALTTKRGQGGETWAGHSRVVLINAVSGGRRTAYEDDIDGPGGFNAASFSADGRLLALDSATGWVVLWDARTGRARRLFADSQPPVWSAALSPDGRILTGTTGQGGVSLWETDHGNLVRHLQTPSRWTGSLTFSPDGHTLAGSGGQDAVLLWDIR